MVSSLHTLGEHTWTKSGATWQQSFSWMRRMNDSMPWVYLVSSRTLQMEQRIMCLLVTWVDLAVDVRMVTNYVIRIWTFRRPKTQKFWKKPDFWAQKIVRTCHPHKPAENTGKVRVRKNWASATVFRDRVFKRWSRQNKAVAVLPDDMTASWYD